MKTLKRYRKYFMLLFIIGVSARACPQGFEGTYNYQIKYTARSGKISIKNLARELGTAEVISLKKGLYKTIRTCGSDTLGTLVYSEKDRLSVFHARGDKFSLITQINPDSAERVKKSDSLVRIGDYLCEVFQSRTETSVLTFYTLKDSGLNPFYYFTWYHFFGPFHGPVVKLLIENKDYLTTETLVSRNEKKFNPDEFSAGKYLKVASPNDVINKIIDTQREKQFQTCIYKNLGYPVFMQLANLEGKAWIDFLVDSTGKLSNLKVEPDYFRTYGNVDKLSNHKRIDRICKKLEKRAVRLCCGCVKEQVCNSPVTKSGRVNAIIRVPVAFISNRAGTSGAFYDDYYDGDDYYDYYDFYDYRD